MSFLDLDANQETNLRERAALNPLDLSAGAGIFDGALTAPVKGLAKGLIAEPARALNLALSAVPRAIDTVRGGTEAQDWWFEKTVSERSSVGEFTRAVTPDPHTTGIVGQVLNSFFDIGGQALTVGPTGVAILKGTAKSAELVDKGVDATTARKAAAAEGAILGVGVHLPMSIGLRSLGNAFYGAAASAVPSAASRGAVHTILAEAGYPEMAAQYQWLDRQQIAIDVVLGVALGGLGSAIEARTLKSLRSEVRASDVDTALTAHNAKHLEIDTAPGVPRTSQARDTHVAAVTKATEDLIAGRPVDISQTRVTEAEFEPNTRLDTIAAEKAELAKAYDTVIEEPIGPSNDPLVRMRPEQIGEVLVERGPAFLKQGSAELKVGSLGLVKFIWKHGEKSKAAPEMRVSRDDVIRTPEVLRDFAPVVDRPVEGGRSGELTWQVERADGKRVIYTVARFADKGGEQHVVSIFVNEGKTKKAREMPLSEKAKRPAESSGGASTARPGDTAPAASSIEQPGGQKGASKETLAQDAPELRQAEELIASRPDAQVVQADGSIAKAADVMKAGADEIAAAKAEAAKFDTAVNCFLAG